MARIFIDSFESRNLYIWDQVNVDSSIVSTSGLGMKGDFCLDAYGPNGFLMNYLRDALGDVGGVTEVYTSFQYRPKKDDSTILGVLGFSDASGVVCFRLELRNKILRAYIGGANIVPIVKLGTGTTQIEKDTTYLIEVRLKVGDTLNGVIQVKVDSFLDIDYAGSTIHDGKDELGRVQIGAFRFSLGHAYFDNIVMDDSSWIGETEIMVLTPDGAGASTNWTPSAGANYECVDEIPPLDSDYVAINTVGLADTYSIENVPSGVISSIKCVQVQTDYYADGTPTPDGLTQVVRSGGTNYLRFVEPVANYGLWEDDPNDSLPWSETDINNLEIGLESANNV